MYNDENRAMALAKHLNGFDYVLIDTCSLMEDAFPAWMDRLVAAQDYLEDSSTEIYVPKECIEELERHSKNKKDFDKRGPAICPRLKTRFILTRPTRFTSKTGCFTTESKSCFRFLR